MESHRGAELLHGSKWVETPGTLLWSLLENNLGKCLPPPYHPDMDLPLLFFYKDIFGINLPTMGISGSVMVSKLD